MHRNMLVFGGSVGTDRIYGEAGGAVGRMGKRRGVYSAAAEELVLEDDYCDEQMLPEKKRRLAPEQVQLLEQSFEAENKLEPERKGELAKKLGLPPRQIAIWFQNRRARWKNKQLEHDFEALKSSYDALLADHEAILADNQWLRSEVVRLTEKLEAKNSSGEQSTCLPHHEDGASVAAFDGGVPIVKDHLSYDSDWSLPVVAASRNSSYMEPQDFGSYNNGASGGLVYSEEDDGSDDGGAHFSDMFDRGHAALAHGDYAGEVEENVDIWHVGCGTGLLFG